MTGNEQATFRSPNRLVRVPVLRGLGSKVPPDVATNDRRGYVSLGVEHLVVRLPERRYPGPGRRPRGS